MQQVKATIELETGKKITHYTRLRIEQSLFTHHSFELEVPFEELEDSREMFFHQAHQDVCGKAIAFSFEPVLEKGSFAFAFKGIVTEIALKNTSDLVNVFLLKGYSPTILLEDCQTQRTFHDQNFGQIAESILGKYPRNLIKRRIATQHNEKLSYAVQYKETNYAFLSRLAAEQGEWMYYNGKELLIGDHSSSDTIAFEVNGVQTCHMSISLRPSNFSMAVYDYLHDEQYLSKSADQSVDGLGKFSSFALDESTRLFEQGSEQTLYHPFDNQHAVDQTVKIRKAVEANYLVDFRGSGEYPDFSVGVVLDVSSVRPQKDGQATESFGKYRVTEIIHEVDGNGNYVNEFKAIPESAEYPPSNHTIVHPVAHSDLAQVIDNDDPERLGRVKVRFLWASAEQETAWVRVGHPYTGQGKGMIFIPEIDAQVVIGYQGNSPNMPYVITSLYPQKSGEEYTTKDNTIKQILFKGGNMLYFEDDPNANTQRITISNLDKQDKAALIISFEDDGKIQLQTQGDIVLEAAKDISLKAKNISMKADEKINLEAMNFKLNAKQNIEQEATAALKLKGMEIKAQADTTAEVSANAQLKLSSSATTDISGGALVKVEAALIKLN